MIGCGGIASAHGEGYQKNGAEIVALVDLNPAAAEEFRKKHAPEARVFPDVESLLASGVDAISLCTPPSAREEVAVAALGRGIHVLSEKPLAHTIEAGRRIVAAAHASRAFFMTAFRHRFIPPIARMKALILESIRKGIQPACSVEDGFRALEVVQSAYAQS